MEKQTYKNNKFIIIFIFFLISLLSYSSNHINELYSFKLENNNVRTCDSITLKIENKHKKDTLSCTEIILYYIDSSGVFEPYLENRELLKFPVPFTDKFKDAKNIYMKIGPSSTDKISFFIHQPYTIEWGNASPENTRHKKIPIGVLDKEVKIGTFLLEVRYRFSSDYKKKERSIILSFNRSL